VADLVLRGGSESQSIHYIIAASPPSTAREISMSRTGDSHSKIPVNPLVATLIEKDVGNNVRIIRGFVGPSDDDATVVIYQRLDRLSDKVEIPEADILHHAEAPSSPFGGVILWVKKDAEVLINRVEESEPSDGPLKGEMRESRKGRLRMHVPERQVCTSNCAPCYSPYCEVCTSSCWVPLR
jgi:hypothetical protein